MPKKHTFKLTEDSRGNWRRQNLGVVFRNGQPKPQTFYLGKDYATACERVLILEKIWNKVNDRWNRGGGTPVACWDDVTLPIALAVAKGDDTVRIDHEIGEPNSIPARTIVAWLFQLRKDFPWVEINLEDGETQERGEEQLQGTATRNEETAQFIRTQGKGQTLIKALDAFAVWNSEKYGKTGFGKTVQNEIAFLKKQIPDVSLAELNLAFIDHWIDTIKKRPIGKRGPIAPRTATNLIKRIRAFIRWLHRSEFEWRKPEDYEVLPVKVPLSQNELAKKVNSDQVQTYSLDELCVLYEYALPWERLFLLLGLNCGFSRAEITTLQQDEIHGPFIKRLRFKTRVYGEWKLWDETIQAIEYARKIRPKSDATELIVNRSGKPLHTPTDGGNQNQTVSNAWQRLLKRVKKDYPDFKCLGFKFIRKTAGNIVRDLSDGEIAAVFLSHGQSVASDDLLEAYTNRPFKKLFAVLGQMHDHLRPMFSKVEVPFPDEILINKGKPRVKEERPELSLGKIKRIQNLHRQGYKVQKIAELAKVSETTVRRYIRKKSK